MTADDAVALLDHLQIDSARENWESALVVGRAASNGCFGCAP